MKLSWAGALLVGAVLFGVAPGVVRAQDDEGGSKPEEKKPETQPRPPRGDGEGREGREGRRGRGGFGRGMMPTDELKEKLGLTDEQLQKLEKIQDEMRESFRKSRESMQEGGGFDPTKFREAMQKSMEQMRDSIRGILTEEQKPKFDAWVKEREARMQNRGGPGGGNPFDPERMKKRMLDQAEKELALTPEEKAAVMPLVQSVLDARAEARTAGDKRKEEFTSFVRKNTGSTEQEKAELTAKLAEYRKARDAEQTKIKDAQQALREVLTVENEARLVAIGILD